MNSLAIPLTGRVPTRGHAPKLVWFNGENSWGKNPYGKPLYRVIWSESRTWLLGGCWGDTGAIEYRVAPYYGSRKEWVLEKWLTSREYAGPEEQWPSDTIDNPLSGHGIVVYTMGPYPKQGWYEHVFSFPSDGVPNIEELAPIFEQSKHLSFQQIKDGIKLRHELSRKDWERKVEDGLNDALPAFGNKATNLGNTKPTMDTVLSTPQEIREAIARYKGEKPEDFPEFEQLPRSGFSIPQRKI